MNAYERLDLSTMPPRNRKKLRHLLEAIIARGTVLENRRIDVAYITVGGAVRTYLGPGRLVGWF